jgi:hypothetical protein
MSGTPYLDEPYLFIEWDGDRRWVHTEWKAWANTEEIKAALEYVLKAIEDNRATKLLADCTGRKAVEIAAQEYQAQTWLPRAAGLGLKHMAMVMPRSEVAKHNVESLAGMYATQLDTQTFATLAEAEGWLRNAGTP